MGNWFSSTPVDREEERTREAERKREEERILKEVENRARTTTPSYSSQTNQKSSVSKSAVDFVGSVDRNQTASPSTISPPLTYATIVRRNCVPTMPNNNIPSVVSPSITSKSDFERFQLFLYRAIIRESYVLNWNIMATNGEYQLVPLEPLSDEYSKVFNQFSVGIFGEIFVIQIERVQNPYLLGQYNLKKLEYQNKQTVEERLLFHGTKYMNIDSICRDNFNWRLHGDSEGHIFGKGVSFTPISSYANHYCDEYHKVMILAKVLVSKTCGGNKNMKIPDFYDKSRFLRYDTSVKEPTRQVQVKYCDDEFYPAYLIHFQGYMFYPKKEFFR